MSSSSFSLYALAFLSLSLLLSTTPTDARTELGLSPESDSNILQHDPFVDAPKVVEKPFRFPSLIDVDSFGPDLRHHVGYVRLRENSTARMFYYLFKSRSKRADPPLIIHLTGGPGFSASLAVFYENGPFRLNNKLSLFWNKYGWDTLADILFIDQPIGTGFSYSTDVGDIPITSEQAADDIYQFLQAFLDKHPDYMYANTYLSGDSYAGRCLLVLASQIRETNISQGININLKGILISSAWIDPDLQFQEYPDYASNMNLITEVQGWEMGNSFKSCHHQVQKSCDGTNYNLTGCVQAYVDCDDILWENIINRTNNNLNFYDIRKKCDPNTTLCYDFSNMERFLNQSSVKKALGVDESIGFVSWSTKVSDAMAGDVMRSFAEYIPELLESGIKLMVYVGQYDLICNSQGNFELVSDLNWTGQNSFHKAAYVPFKVGRVVAGMRTSYGPLSYVDVNNSGHFVTMDQPKATLEMLRRWMNGIPL